METLEKAKKQASPYKRRLEKTKNQGSPYKRRQIIIPVANNLLALDTCNELCNIILVAYDLLALACDVLCNVISYDLLALDTCDELCNVISVTYDLLALDA